MKDKDLIGLATQGSENGWLSADCTDYRVNKKQ